MQITKKLIDKIDGQEVFLLKFTNNNNYSVSFFNFGGYINSIHIPYHKDPSQSEDVLLGYRNFQGYVNDQSYMNCIVGRVCGRISNAKFYLNKKKYTLYANDGFNHLHGGKEGFNKKVWKIVNINQSPNCLECVLEHVSPHLEEGYPGQLKCQVTYLLTNNNEFIIYFDAISDRNTIINLTNHNYWNFHGHQSYYQNIENHFVQMDAQYYFESDDDLIPTGKLHSVENTKFDFLNYKKLDQSILQNKGIDTCYYASIASIMLDQISLNKFEFRRVAKVYSNLTKMGIVLYTKKPGLQFYTGNMMNKKYDGKYNKRYGYQYGLCLEPQFFPNSINSNKWGKAILTKGEKYNSKIVMKLKNNF